MYLNDFIYNGTDVMLIVKPDRPLAATIWYVYCLIRYIGIQLNKIFLKFFGGNNELPSPYKHMTSSDYIYTGMQIGMGTNYMPTMEQTPSYTVHVVGAYYIHSF